MTKSWRRKPAEPGDERFGSLRGIPMGLRLADFYNVEAWRRGQIVDDRISAELRLNIKTIRRFNRQNRAEAERVRKTSELSRI